MLYQWSSQTKYPSSETTFSSIDINSTCTLFLCAQKIYLYGKNGKRTNFKWNHHKTIFNHFLCHIPIKMAFVGRYDKYQLSQRFMSMVAFLGYNPMLYNVSSCTVGTMMENRFQWSFRYMFVTNGRYKGQGNFFNTLSPEC